MTVQDFQALVRRLSLGEGSKAFGTRETTKLDRQVLLATIAEDRQVRFTVRVQGRRFYVPDPGYL